MKLDSFLCHNKTKLLGIILLISCVFVFYSLTANAESKNFPTFFDESKKYSTYQLQVDDGIYEIKYRLSNGQLDKIKPTELGLIITISVVEENAVLELLFETPAYDKIMHASPIFPVGSLIILDSDGEELSAYYQRSTCSKVFLAMSIPAEETLIELISRQFTDSVPFTETISDGIPMIIPTSTPNGTKYFGVITNAKECDFSFNIDEKQLQINLKNPTDGSTYIEIPQNLLGGPYQIYINNKPADFLVLPTTGAHGFSRIVFPSNEDTTGIYLNYTNAKTIYIIGTTVIPEFPTGMVVLLGAMSLFVILNRCCKVLGFSRSDIIRKLPTT